MKNIVKDLLDEDINWAYSPTNGLKKTRDFISKIRLKRTQISNLIYFLYFYTAING